jgi:hypothetical protein
MRFEEFWRFYCREHSRPLTRRLHFAGTILGPLSAAGLFAATRRPLALLAWPAVSYAFAWAGHFLVEKNRPATFRYPFLSLAADHVMFAKMLTGTMDRELERAFEDVPAVRA